MNQKFRFQNLMVLMRQVFLAGVQWLGIYIKAVVETGRFDFTVEQLAEIGGLSNEEV